MSALPTSIAALIQSPRVLNWMSLHSSVKKHLRTEYVNEPPEQQRLFDQEFEHCLFERMRTSPNPVNDAIGMFCYLSKNTVFLMDSLLERLKKDVCVRFSSGSMIDLLQGMYALETRSRSESTTISRRGFLKACQSILKETAAPGLFEKFKVVVYEITRLLDVQQGGNFWALRVLEIAEARKGAGCFRERHEVQDWLDPFAESLKETDEDGNTCLNYMLGSSNSSNSNSNSNSSNSSSSSSSDSSSDSSDSSDSNYTYICTILEITQIYDACEGAICIPNHKGTIPHHNMLYYYGSSNLVQKKLLLQVCKNMMDYFPSAVLYPSLEFHGRTPLHTILPRGFLAAQMPRGGDLHRIFKAFWAGVESAIEKHPNALHLVDDYGLTPLHHFILCEDNYGSWPLYSEHFAQLAANLVSPTAARTASNEGRLPLHTALEREVDIVDELREAAPETVERRDPESFLYPFLMAKDANTSYKLLRMAPHLTTSALSTKVHTAAAAKLGVEAKQDVLLHKTKRSRMTAHK